MASVVWSACAFAETADERLERAKALFREGNALLGAGDPERALERFLLSREVVPSGKNTANTAICLERLGRFDEALEMYEEVLSRFAADLEPQDRENLAPIMSALRRGLGSLELAANVEGLLTIDGKPRGRLPRSTPVRVLPGKRRVRIAKEGYASFDQTVEVGSGESLSVDATLEPLAGMGALRVELNGNTSAQVLVDGKRAGVAPWEGTLRVGTHSLQVLGEDLGSKPEALQVLERKTLLVRVSLSELGPEQHVTVEPTTATLSLAGVELGHGSWVGRLPIGTYVVRAAEPGYFPRSAPLTVPRWAPPSGLAISLLRDRNHPRWPQATRWHWSAGLTGAFAYAPALNGDQEEPCPEDCKGTVNATGGKIEASAEVLHDFQWGFELGLGYFLAHQAFTRAAFAGHDAGLVSYALQQKLAMGGGYARAGGVARLELRRGFAVRAGLGVGLARMVYVAEASGVAWNRRSLDVVGAAGFGYEPVVELIPMLTSGVSLEHAIGPIFLTLGFGAWFVPTQGPRFTGVELAVTAECKPARPDGVECAPASTVLASERVHGRFVMGFSELTLGHRF